MINKVTMAIVAGLFVSPFIMPEQAHAISAHYRAQLERSGCTQVTESNGTCDIHKTKAENAKAAKTPAMQEHAKIAAMLEDSVIGQSTDDAYAALEKDGFENPEPLKWTKGKNVVMLDVNPHGIVAAATLR